MKNFVYLSVVLTLITVVPVLGANVVKVGESNRYVTVSHDISSRWQVGQKLCILERSQKVACGNVTKSMRRVAILRISKKKKNYQIKEKAVVISANDKITRSPASRPGISELSAEEAKRTSNAQISFELLGAGILYSIFGSYRINDKFAVNLGLSYFSVSSGITTSTVSTSASVSVFQIPASASLLLGSEGSYFELLAGADIVFGSASGSSSGITGSASSGGLFPEIGIGWAERLDCMINPYLGGCPKTQQACRESRYYTPCVISEVC